jgi:hypothetical protein
MTNRITLSIAAMAATSLALAACGGGGSSAASSREEQREKFEEAALKHAECMRRNGVDVPDPKPGRGGILFNGGDVPPETLEAAEKKCRKHLAGVRPPELSPEDEREFRDKALKHAQCMREQGFDFPDPKFSANGRVTQALRGIDPNDPGFQEAEKKCRKEAGLDAVMGGGPRP